jgi:transposase-like protein
MSHRHTEKDTVYDQIMELLIHHGTDELTQVYETLYNEAMLIERERHLHAETYQRTEQRQGYANGFKDKKLKSKAGTLRLKIPQVRDSSFYPASLERPLGRVVYLYLDARYEKVRHGGSVRDCAVLIASGVLPSGHRSLLGVSVSLSAHEVHWRTLLQSLLARGLCGLYCTRPQIAW